MYNQLPTNQPHFDNKLKFKSMTLNSGTQSSQICSSKHFARSRRCMYITSLSTLNYIWLSVTLKLVCHVKNSTRSLFDINCKWIKDWLHGVPSPKCHSCQQQVSTLSLKKHLKHSVYPLNHNLIILMQQTISEFVLRVESDFLLNQLSTQVPNPHLQKVFPM